jgi:hypothetical protein
MSDEKRTPGAEGPKYKHEPKLDPFLTSRTDPIAVAHAAGILAEQKRARALLDEARAEAARGGKNIDPRLCPLPRPAGACSREAHHGGVCVPWREAVGAAAHAAGVAEERARCMTVVGVIRTGLGTPEAEHICKLIELRIEDPTR